MIPDCRDASICRVDSLHDGVCDDGVQFDTPDLSCYNNDGGDCCQEHGLGLGDCSGVKKTHAHAHTKTT